MPPRRTRTDRVRPSFAAEPRAPARGTTARTARDMATATAAARRQVSRPRTRTAPTRTPRPSSNAVRGQRPAWEPTAGHPRRPFPRSAVQQPVSVDLAERVGGASRERELRLVVVDHDLGDFVVGQPHARGYPCAGELTEVPQRPPATAVHRDGIANGTSAGRCGAQTASRPSIAAPERCTETFECGADPSLLRRVSGRSRRGFGHHAALKRSGEEVGRYLPPADHLFHGDGVRSGRPPRPTRRGHFGAAPGAAEIDLRDP